MTVQYQTGKLICTTANGAVAIRKTNNKYQSAIVGKRLIGGKPMVVFASWGRDGAVDALKNFKAGNFVNQNFKLCTDFEIV